MRTCDICGSFFTEKRREQRLCSVRCRQRKNASARKGVRTGPQKNRIYKRATDRDGYIRLYAGNHPYAGRRKMICEHVMIMELIIGRAILPNECVHHINGIRSDNRIENLQLMSRSSHSKLHGPHVSMKRKRIHGRFA